MRRRISCLSVFDAFVQQLARRLSDELVWRVVLPPGFDAYECLELLDAAAADEAENLLYFPSSRDFRIDSSAAVLSEIARLLRLPDSAPESAEELVVHHTDRFRRSRTVGLIISDDISDAQRAEVFQTCEEIAEFTRDLEGKFNFVLLQSYWAAPAARPGEVSPRSFEPGEVVWQPWTPQVKPLRFESAFTTIGMTESRLENSGFERYLGLRLYWEASGAPEYMERLSDIDELRSFWIADDDADDKIERKFDDLLADAGGKPAHVSALFDACAQTCGTRVLLSTGIIRACPDALLQELLGAGVAWIPPNGLHLRVTSVAARQILADKKLREKWEITDDKARNFRLAARKNPLLASWVSSLTRMVEMEMLFCCKQAGNLAEILNNLGRDAELEELRNRARRYQSHAEPTEPIDHASFGQLQYVIFHSPLQKDFPVSRSRIEEIRRTRNLVAHAHAVRWSGVRVLLQTLASLHAAGVQAR